MQDKARKRKKHSKDKKERSRKDKDRGVKEKSGKETKEEKKTRRKEAETVRRQVLAPLRSEHYYIILSRFALHIRVQSLSFMPAPL